MAWGKGCRHVDKAEVVDGQRDGPGVSQGSKVMDVESVHALASRCPCERPQNAAQPAVLGDGTDAEARSGAERTVERMAGLPSEQSEGVVAVEGEQRTAQVPDVGRVTLAVTFGTVRVDPEVHGLPATTLAGGYSRWDRRWGRRSRSQL